MGSNDLDKIRRIPYLVARFLAIYFGYILNSKMVASIKIFQVRFGYPIFVSQEFLDEHGMHDAGIYIKKPCVNYGLGFCRLDNDKSTI
jgi:hypothetical protein